MVVPIDESEIRNLPLHGGSLGVIFENRNDVVRQARDFISNLSLFIETDIHPAPFSEFELYMHLPDKTLCPSVPARVVQLVIGKQAGILIQFLNLADEVRDKIKDYLAEPEPVRKPERDPEDSGQALSATESPVDLEEKPDVPRGRMSLHEKLRKMTVSDRARLAKRADQKTRAILIRDHEPKVLLFLLQNPYLRRGEVLDISRSRRINHQTIQQILANRVWAQNEELRYNLVLNPKTPLTTALKLLPGLNMKHLRELAKNHGIKQRIKQSALRLVLERNP